MELTREVRDSAQAGDWPKVVELEAVRRPLIDEIFAQPAPEIDAASIREILGSDRELLALARSQRETTGKNNLANRRSRRAIDQYAQTAGGGTGG